jgi:hypothetical protein
MTRRIAIVDALAYYAAQSPITDPGPMVYLFDGLPTDVSSLRRIASGLVVHYRADDLKAIGIPDERVKEINTRYVEQMLRRIIELDDRPLTEERAKNKRLVGCCRDFTVLFLAMLRHHGVPARGRVGFASYFTPGWKVDHEVAEVWDGAEHCWRLIDAELADTHVDPTDDAKLDAMDLPRDRFMVGGTAWHACRSGQADPERFLVDPGLEIPETRGWLQLRHNLVQDLAALNKREMLLWDTWGLLEDDSSSASGQAFLDRVAEATRQDDPPFAVVQSLYMEEAGLRVPEVVTSFNLISGTPERVAVSV